MPEDWLQRDCSQLQILGCGWKRTHPPHSLRAEHSIQTSSSPLWQGSVPHTGVPVSVTESATKHQLLGRGRPCAGRVSSAHRSQVLKAVVQGAPLSTQSEQSDTPADEVFFSGPTISPRCKANAGREVGQERGLKLATFQMPKMAEGLGPFPEKSPLLDATCFVLFFLNPRAK